MQHFESLREGRRPPRTNVSFDHSSFSPTSSPCQGTSDIKSPAFQLFSVTSGASTPGFSGFGFDVGSGQDEVRSRQKEFDRNDCFLVLDYLRLHVSSSQESSFAFAGPLFNEKVLHFNCCPSLFHSVLIEQNIPTFVRLISEKHRTTVFNL